MWIKLIKKTNRRHNYQSSNIKNPQQWALLRSYFGGGSFLSDPLPMLSFLSDLLDLGVPWSAGLDVKNESRPSSAFSPAPVSWAASCGRADGRLLCGPRGRDLAMWVSFVEVSGKLPKESSSTFSNRESSLIPY